MHALFCEIAPLPGLSGPCTPCQPLAPRGSLRGGCSEFWAQGPCVQLGLPPSVSHHGSCHTLMGCMLLRPGSCRRTPCGGSGAGCGRRRSPSLLVHSGLGLFKGFLVVSSDYRAAKWATQSSQTPTLLPSCQLTIQEENSRNWPPQGRAVPWTGQLSHAGLCGAVNQRDRTAREPDWEPPCHGRPLGVPMTRG